MNNFIASITGFTLDVNDWLLTVSQAPSAQHDLQEILFCEGLHVVSVTAQQHAE